MQKCPGKKKKRIFKEEKQKKNRNQTMHEQLLFIVLNSQKKKKKVRKAAQPATRRHCSKPNRKIAHTQITSGTHLLISKAVFSFLYFLLRLSLCTKKTKFDMMRAKQPTLHKYYARPFVTPNSTIAFLVFLHNGLVCQQTARKRASADRERELRPLLSSARCRVLLPTNPGGSSMYPVFSA